MADEQDKPVSKEVAEQEHPNKDAMQQAWRTLGTTDGSHRDG